MDGWRILTNHSIARTVADHIRRDGNAGRLAGAPLFKSDCRQVRSTF
jgi:hypothetical protein